MLTRKIGSGVQLVRARLLERRIRRENPQLINAFKVESHLTASERVKLFQLAQNRTVICEIGSYTGASACCFGEAASSNPGSRVICIDTWHNDAMSEGSKDTWVAFKKNTSAYRSSITPIRGYSHEVVRQVAEVADFIDLLFIDGDHSYEGVLKDWTHYKGFLRPGSIVVFHDFGWAEGVQKVVKEEFIPMSECFSQLPNMCWGTIRQQTTK